MDNIAQLRKSYERAELDEAASNADPTEQFQLWLTQALEAQLPEPNAMTLATVGADGRPSTRVVLIKSWHIGVPQQVFAKDLQGQNGYFLLSLPFLSRGVYYLQLQGSAWRQTEKIVIQ